MHKYDAALVVGSKFDERAWRFPPFLYSALDAARLTIEHGQADHVIVSGKWAIKFDWLDVTPPYRECDIMADYLLAAGLAPDRILREGLSKDTISNFYYVKTTLLIPRQLTSLLIICADWRLPRLKLLSQRILGSGYSVDFQTVATSPGEANPDEAEITATQMAFLAPMADGDHQWLENSFYTGPLYDHWKVRARQKQLQD